MFELVIEVLKSISIIAFVCATATSPALAWIVGIGFTLEIIFNVVGYLDRNTNIFK